MLRTAVALLGAMLTLTPAMLWAADVETLGATVCKFGAFATDTDPTGSNIRAAPRRDAALIGQVPPLHKLWHADDIVGAEFEVIGAKDGWLLIRNVETDNPANGKPLRVFTGPGWLSGSLAGLEIGDGRLRRAAGDNAPVDAWLMDTDQGWVAHNFSVERIHGCNGNFADVTVASPEGKKRRGWIGHFCQIQMQDCFYAYPDEKIIPESYRYPD